MASAVTNRLSRDEFRKAKELEELRKTGAAPPELDDEGRIINPHIPQYMSAAPWYYHSTRPGLKHQYLSKYKPQVEAPSIHAPNKVVHVQDAAGTVYKPGACTNCGSTTHSAKDCLERPRRRGAAHGGAVVGRDEWVEQQQLDYDGKRDRWKGYDAAEYHKVIERYEKADLERKKLKLQELEAAYRGDSQQHDNDDSKTHTDRKDGAEAKESKSDDPPSTAAEGSSTSSSSGLAVEQVRVEGIVDGRAAVSSGAAEVKESDADKLKRLKREKRLHKLRKKIALVTAASGSDAATGASSSTRASASSSDTDSDTDTDGGSDEDLADSGAVITKMDSKARITVRNLRIREDTAKYLRNLDPNSAYYDPKSRSMKQNPYPGRSPDEVLYAGDNFLRASGDVQDIGRLHKYVWDSAERQQLEAEAGTGADGDLAAPGMEVHAVALPSAAEKLYQAHKAAAAQHKAQSKNAIMHRYGGAEHLVGPALPSMLQHVDAYVEYDDAGRVVRGGERVTVRSKYVEDAYEDGHTAVWGSWWDCERRCWGYACCHGTVRHAICLGAAGRDLDTVMQPPLSSMGGKWENEQCDHKDEVKDDSAAAGRRDEGRGEKRRREEEPQPSAVPAAVSFQQQQPAFRSYLQHPTDSEQDAYHRNQRRRDDPIPRPSSSNRR